MNMATLFQQCYLPTTWEAYSRNIYIPATGELINNNPTLTLYKQLPGFNLNYMNIMNYQLMQSLNVAQLLQGQLEKLSHKLPNYTMVNYDLSKQHIHQIDNIIHTLCFLGI